MYGCEPTDPRIANMDDVTRTWMYFSWLESQSEENLKLRKVGCLIGSFWNPQAAKEILGVDDGSKISTTEDEFEAAFEKYVRKPREEAEAQKAIPKNRRKRRKQISLKKKTKETEPPTTTA